MKKKTESKSMYFDRDVLVCLSCRSEKLVTSPEAIKCKSCNTTYAIRDGIPVLLSETSAFTRLDVMNYDDHHNIDEDRREKVSDDWQDVFDDHGVNYGDVLEIGCGTGQLTWGLAKQLPFKSVHACDISFGFLSGLRKDLENHPGLDVNYYLCDANDMPFRKDSFDLVVGHSVLHHFLGYEHVIQQVQGFLRPGGRAVFYEPVIQGKILIAFFGELMIRLERNVGWGVLDEEDLKKIQHMTRHLTKSKWVADKPQVLEQMEDKYIFDLVELGEKAREWGFSRFEFANSGKPHWGYKWHVQQHLLMAGIAPEKIQKFTFMFNAFGHTVSDLTPGSLVTPMGYLVFIK